ncbi:DMT family transporter [Planktomarina temperata]|jgi:drug/metabolite transporter (DMT)-like permease|uniref:DMT family transporter n=1 Tax=Planktomarina TaxID=1284657 RepID=UPI00014D63A7|nr:DMT family transporter [Planktomarina temperata]MDA9267997.1 DMT family transporter [bacterium]MDO7708154.1 DMT family transporter [Paracoccaceae bacterium]MDA7455409.1 DMT family transporter [Planktomarina temperata]MDA7458806.1 DMT family transporter [Planktomarina temperata]
MTTNIRAILVCLLAYFCFDLMSVHVRILSASYSPQELSVYRNVLGVLPSILLLMYTRELSFDIKDYKIKKWKLAFGRGLLVALAQLLFYTALADLELATVSALGQTNAIFIVLIAVIFYGEKVGAWRWSAVIIGFGGAVWIMQPGSNMFTWTAALPIGAAFCYAASMVTLRSFDVSISSAIIYLYSSIAAALGAILLATGTTDFSPIQSMSDALLILSMSLCGGFGVVFLMYAFRQAPASVLAPFSYFGILTAFGLGWIVFDELPLDKLFPGVILIILSGLTILWREERNKT